MGGGSLGTATYTITGNAQGAVNAARQAQSGLDQLSKVVATNWWGVKNLGLQFAALPAAMAAGVGYAIKAAKDWQDSMFQVQRTSGATGEELKGIEADLRAVARQTPIAASQIADLASQGAALGVPNKFLGEFSRIMGNLIATTDLTSASVDEFARVVNVMQVPVSQWEQFANVLLEVGRNTAATETEILNMAKRIAPAAQAAGVAWDQVLGLSAAVLSLGPRAEAGGTAINKTFADMARAVSKGVSGSNKELNLFADTANMTAAQFVDKFRSAPGEAFADLMTGLGHLRGGYEQQIKVLDALGIKEVRQAQALIALAGGTRSVGDEQRNLNAIFGATGKWLTNSNALQELSAEKANTLSGQLVLLRNIVDQNAAVFGQMFLPKLAMVINFLSRMILGFGALPGPLKAVLLLFGGLIGLLSAVVAGFLLLAPRLLIARDAFNQIMVSIQNARSSFAGFPQILAATGAEATLMAANFERAAGIVQISGYRAQSGLEALALAAQGAQAMANQGKVGVAGAAGQAAGGMSKGARGGLLAMGLLTAGTIALGVVTNKLGKEQQDTAKSAAALSDETLHLDDATGAVDPKLIQEEGNLKKAAKAARELRDRLEALAQAHLGLVDAQRGQEAALKGVEDAQRNYQRVLAENYDTTREIERAELELAQARNQQEQAARDLAKAEYNLDHAREIAEAKIADAESNLADARDKQIGISEKIIDLEQQLVDLRGADYLEKIADAEQDLANARTKLGRADQFAQDAEWQLQYLRQEGASARDIADAELTLAEARNDVANAQDDVSDGEKKLSDLRDETARNREIARIEREIAAAHRDAAGAARDITEKERDLADLRKEFGDGKYLVDAQNAYRDAQLDVAKAIQSVRQAELDLNDVRTGRAAREITDAYNSYEDALFGVAKANVEMRKQQALARGEIFDSGDEAHALSEELQKLSDSMPAGDMKDKFKGMADTLAKAPNVPDPVPADDSVGGAGVDPASWGLPTNADLQKYLDGLINTVNNNKGPAKKAGFDWGTTIGGAMSGAMTGAMIGSAVPGVGTVAGAIIGGLIGALSSNYPQIYDYFKNTIGPSFYDGLLVIGDFFSGLVGKVKEWFTNFFINPIRNLFRMHSPSRLMMDIGIDIIQGFIDGVFSLGDTIRGIAWNIASWITTGFNTVRGWLSSAGALVIEGFMDGVRWVLGTIGTIGGTIWSTLMDNFSGAGGWLYDKGRALIDGLRDGIKWAFDNSLKPIWNWIIDKLPGDLGKGWKIASPSKVFSEIGGQLMQGLAVGIDGNVPAVDAALRNMTDLVNSSMDTVVPKSMLESLMSSPSYVPPGAYAAPSAGATQGETNNYYNDTFNLEAHTDADAPEIVNEFMWAKMIRPRGR
jgi:TP901 family phage tail tape measure protein